LTATHSTATHTWTATLKKTKGGGKCDMGCL